MGADKELELLQGTLDLLILKALSWGPRHGYAVARWIADRTHDELVVEDGALYTALHRLQKRGWVESEWGRSKPTGRPSTTSSRPRAARSSAPEHPSGNDTRPPCRESCTPHSGAEDA